MTGRDSLVGNDFMAPAMLLFLDKVYVERPDGSLRFRWVKVPASVERTRLPDAPTNTDGAVSREEWALVHHQWMTSGR
jgi:hypothetical protein